MSAEPVVALVDVRLRAIDRASNEKIKMLIRARPRGMPALRSIVGVAGNGSARRAPKQSADINVVRCGLASQSTAQK